MNKKFTFVRLFFALIVLSFFTERTFAQVTFTPKTDIALTASIGAMFMIPADINSDGKQDLITANQNSNGISILLNTTVINSTTPSFSAQVNFATGTAPHSVAAGDINGDGLLDLAAVNTTSSTASVFLNTTTPGASTPTLSTKTDFVTGTNPYSVVLKDMNGDGKLDMVVSNQVGNSIGIFINTTTPGASTPTFGAMTAFTTPAGPTHLAVADFNGDGLLDVAVPNNTAANISVFFNTTTPGSSMPTFGTRADFTAGSTVWSVATGDFNLDGKIDIACANRGASSLSYFLNTSATGSATPSFSAKTDLTVGSTPFGVGVGDMNNDGKPDILNAARGAAQFSVFLNNTSPGASTLTLLTRTDNTTASQPYFPIIADFNGDGKKDVAVDCGTGNSISVFINTTELGAGAPSFGTKTDLTVNSYPEFVCSADFNGDGKPDIANTNLLSNNICIFLNTVTPGASSPSFSSKTDFTTGTSPISIKAADFNGDGKPDLACVNAIGGTISVYINTTSTGAGTPAFTPKTDFSTGLSPAILTLNDFNGDGLIDIACSNYNGGNVSVLLNSTTPGTLTPSFTSAVNFTTGGAAYGVVSRDLNNDGKPDIACCNGISGTISILFNITTAGSMTPSFAPQSDIFANTNVFAISAEDINGDGKIDFVTNYAGSNLISVFINNTAIGGLTQSFSKTDIIYSEARDILLKDFNGDGKADITTVDYIGNTMSIMLNTTTAGSSTPSFAARTDFATVTTPYGLSSADFNLDGKPDAVCANGNPAGPLSVFLNTAFYPLPVELASFTSSVNGNNVMLNWNTVMEENNSGFEIERNSFGAEWNKIGFVAGKGTTNTQQSYSFTDNGLNSGRYSYRLKQIDYNGNYKYYDLQNEVVIGVPSKFALMQNYPNPFNPSTIINYQLAINSFVSLKIYDISGREVKQLVNTIQPAGYYTVSFDAKNLSSGMYFNSLKAGEYSSVKKMVLVK
ncbi:MAG: T9SS type A sorting domain-containing protein [Ignavibacteria bacterium]|nr:T9SS type A sorting domain-containing protein [Ignavibacteria bacterium]